MRRQQMSTATSTPQQHTSGTSIWPKVSQNASPTAGRLSPSRPCCACRKACSVVDESAKVAKSRHVVEFKGYHKRNEHMPGYTGPHTLDQQLKVPIALKDSSQPAAGSAASARVSESWEGRVMERTRNRVPFRRAP